MRFSCFCFRSWQYIHLLATRLFVGRYRCTRIGRRRRQNIFQWPKNPYLDNAVFNRNIVFVWIDVNYVIDFWKIYLFDFYKLIPWRHLLIYVFASGWNIKYSIRMITIQKGLWCARWHFCLTIEISEFWTIAKMSIFPCPTLRAANRLQS